MKSAKEPMLASVQRELQATKGDWPRVAEESGVPYQTITKIGGGFIADPRVSTVQTLFDYFEAHPRSDAGAGVPSHS